MSPGTCIRFFLWYSTVVLSLDEQFHRKESLQIMEAGLEKCKLYVILFLYLKDLKEYSSYNIYNINQRKFSQILTKYNHIQHYPRGGSKFKMLEFLPTLDKGDGKNWNPNINRKTERNVITFLHYYFFFTVFPPSRFVFTSLRYKIIT